MSFAEDARRRREELAQQATEPDPPLEPQEDIFAATRRDEEQASEAAAPVANEDLTTAPKNEQARPPREKRSSYLPEIHRTLPQSEDAEKGVLSSCLQAPSLIGTIFDQISTAEFYHPGHRLIAETMVELNDTSDVPIEFISLTQILKDRGQLDKAGGPAAISELYTFVPTASNFDYYVAVLREKAMRRSAILEATAFIERAYGEQGDPKVLLDEFEETIKSIGVERAVEGVPSSLSIRTVGEILSMDFDESDNYFADRVIAAGQAVTVLGPGGVGKSRLMLQMALCMITGRQFLNVDTHARGKKWLFLQAENSNRRLKNDLGMMMTGLRLVKDDVQLVDASLFLHTIETDSDAFMDLENSNDLTQIRRLVDTYKPDVVLFDPLNTFSSLDLNSDRDMRVLISAITRTVKRGNPNRIPLVIHHSLTGKAGAARAVGWDKSSYGRNSKALFAWTRAQINIAPRDPDKPSELVVTCGKNNNGKMFADIGVVFDDQIGLYRVDQNFDSDEFRETVGLEETRRAKPTPAQIADLFDLQIYKAGLVSLLKDRYGTPTSTAYKLIDNAVAKKAICERTIRGKKSVYYKPAS